MNVELDEHGLVDLAQERQELLSAQAEHKPRHAEGPFFANLLEVIGYPDSASGTNPTKRIRLVNKIKEACCRNGSGTVVLSCDEAQRYEEGSDCDQVRAAPKIPKELLDQLVSKPMTGGAANTVSMAFKKAPI